MIGGDVIDGRPMAEALLSELRNDIDLLTSSGRAPGLAVLLAGDDYAARAYERRLRSIAEEVDCYYVHERLDAAASEADALAAVGKLNADPRITGVLVLRPLPDHISEEALYRILDPGKDIESVHPLNAGLLALGEPRFIPSTPAAAFHMLDQYLGQEGRDPVGFYEGATVVLVGRSNNVGKPGVWLGLERNATVISCNHHTYNAGKLADFTRQADVLIVAAGVPGLITADDVKAGVIVIDIGINPVKDEVTGKTRLVGDVDYDSVIEVAGAVSPVPGGVGPITDVWLLRNTVLAAQQ